ncbi:hypothetical protein D2E25_1691 [Bifidobacterium goeldii]|uniref:Colicin transporter n=1 Tax=Bifidobacterium goeldii TaxID=2306975 RepID=A0A430FFV0_9BIFI|nr:hypothetical protein [Bifidobacterium goeldii]RSX51716.1 hypothetical protein D2E25_1691 [Bifidobacterium goeldii]
MATPDKKELAVATEAKNKKKTGIIVAAVVAVVIVIAAVAGWALTRGDDLESLKAQCATASEELRLAQNDYNNLLNGDAAEASAYTKDDVKDASTISALADEMSVEVPELAACNVDTAEEFKAQNQKIADNTTWYQEHTKSLDKAVKAVNNSLK